MNGRVEVTEISAAMKIYCVRALRSKFFKFVYDNDFIMNAPKVVKLSK